MTEGLEFGIRDDGTLMVSAGTDQKRVEIPREVDGIAVTAIGPSAFAGMSQIRFVTIAETVERIDEEAFSGCTGLRYVEVNGVLKSIGDKAFSGCSSLTYVDVNEGLESLGDHAFDGCGHLVLSAIPSTVTHIGKGAIAGCSLMSSVSIGKGCAYTVDKGGIVDARTSDLVAVCPGITGKFIVPARCRRITTDAFDGCDKITDLYIHRSVETIDSASFDDCRRLRSINVQRGSTTFKSEEEGRILYSALNERLIRVVPMYDSATVFVPDEVSVISAGAFKGCEKVLTVNLPDGLTELEEGAFEGMPRLKCLQIPPEMSADLPYDFRDRDGNLLGVNERAGFRFLLENGTFLKSGKFSNEPDDDNPERIFMEMKRRMSGPEPPTFTPVKISGVSFQDVCGQEKAKEELMDRVLLPQQHPELFEKYKLGTGGGVLLYGPPGTGKTLLAKAVAGELKANFYSVSTTDIYNKWLGESESRIRNLFETARKNTPSIIFLDDFDAIGAKRDQESADWRSGIITQLLVEMQGVTGNNKGVLVMAATNRPQDIDGALKRPGRFDVEIACDLPNEEARADMIRRRMADIPRSRIDYAGLARRTEGFNGADVDRLVSVAKLIRLKENLKGGSDKVGMRDFEAAFATVESSVDQDDVKDTEEYSRTGKVAYKSPGDWNPSGSAKTETKDPSYN